MADMGQDHGSGGKPAAAPRNHILLRLRLLLVGALGATTAWLSRLITAITAGPRRLAHRIWAPLARRGAVVAAPLVRAWRWVFATKLVRWAAGKPRIYMDFAAGPPRLAYAAVLAISSTVVSQWFVSGTFISTGDMGSFIRRGWAPEMAWAWNHQISGAGSAAYTVGRWFEFVLIDLVKLLGGDEPVAQWLFYTIMYGLVGFGVAYTAGALTRNPWAIVAAGSSAVLSGFFLTRLPNPLNVISVGSLALLSGIALRVAQGVRVPAPVAGFALLPTSFLGFNPPMLVVAYAWAAGGTMLITAAFIGRWGFWRLARWFVVGAPWALAMNVFWLLPLAQSFTGGGGAASNATFQDPTNWTWAQINNTVPNVLTMVANWAWFRPQYLPFAADLDRPSWIWLRYMLPALLVLAPAVALRRHRRVALMSLGGCGIMVFLAKGLMAPLGGVNLWMYLNLPGFWLFREPMSKLGQLLVQLFGILIAIGVTGALERVPPGTFAALRARQWRVLPELAMPAAVIFMLLAALAYPYPLYTGSVMPDVRPMQPSAHVRVPQYWWQMAEVIDSDPRPGKVLVLPLDDYYQMPTTWGFFGVDSIANLLIRHPVITPKPDGYFGDSPGFQANTRGVETALLSGDLGTVQRLLDTIGASEVIIRHDLVRGMPGRSFADDRILAAAMARVPGMRQVIEGPLELWSTLSGTSPEVRSYDRTLTASYRPSDGAAVLGSVGTSTTIQPYLNKGPAASATRVYDKVSETRDTVVWPVPAVDDGEPTATVYLPAGDYRIAQRARAAAVLVPELDGEQVRLRDPTAVLVDGQVASTRPDLVLDVPGGDAVAIRAGTRTVALDNWGREALPRPAGAPIYPNTVAIGSATPVTIYSPSAVPADPSEPSEVYNCNNYEPRPWAELGLSREIDEQGVITLTALDHAACTQINVRDAKPGRTYRVRLQYRSNSGKRPQICLWQVGTDGCELAPRAAKRETWSDYERFVTVEEVATSLILVLHADVGERLIEPTSISYRDIQIEALDPVLEDVVFPPQVPERTVSLAAGKHEITVTGGQAGNILAGFEPLEDCFRYDDRTMDEAGLAAEVDGDPDNPTFTLKAREHMACIGSTAPDMGASSLYEFSLTARSVAVRDPKFCLYLRGPDSCKRLPTAGPWLGWTDYEVLVNPDPGAVETRVYLYGMRNIKGSEQSQVQYRDVKLRAVASPVNVVLARQPEVGGAIALESPRSTATQYRKVNPTVFTATAIPGKMLALAEGFAPGWKLSRRKPANAAPAMGSTGPLGPTGLGQSADPRPIPSDTVTARGPTLVAPTLGAAGPMGPTGLVVVGPGVTGPQGPVGLGAGAKQALPDHVNVTSWMNGWEDISGPVRMTYLPAQTARKALLIQPLVIAAAFIWIFLARRWHRRRRAVGPPAGEAVPAAITTAGDQPGPGPQGGPDG